MAKQKKCGNCGQRMNPTPRDGFARVAWVCPYCLVEVRRRRKRNTKI